MKSLILAIIAALLALTQLGCAVNSRPGDLTPEQAALRVNPPRNGAQRLSIVKPAPEGALVVFEDIAQQRQDPSAIGIGYAYVTLQASGWLPSGGGWAGGQPQHSVLLEISSYGSPNERMIIFGKVVDPRAAQVIVGFPGGQVRDTTVNGLFGMVVVPYTLVCRLEFLDSEENRIGLFDYSGTAMDLSELLHGRAVQAKQDCAVPENRP